MPSANPVYNPVQRRQPEPWFFWLPEALCWLALLFGLGASGVWFVMLAASKPDAIVPNGLAWMANAALILFCCAVLLLFVDIARSLRTLCRKS